MILARPPILEELESNEDKSFQDILGSDIGLDDPDMSLRKRRGWFPDTESLVSQGIDLLDEDDDELVEEEEDGAGCPLPSTPEDHQLLEAEVNIF